MHLRSSDEFVGASLPSNVLVNMHKLTYISPRCTQMVVIFLALDFGCTLPPIVHPIIEYQGEPNTFNQPCGDLGITL